MRSDQDDTIDAAGPRRRRRTVTALRIAAATAATAVLVVTGLGWAAHHELTSGILRSGALDVLTGGDRNSRHGDSNILLIGLDSRKDMHGNDLPAEFVTDELHAGDSDAGGYNTNTLILLHVPGDGSRATAAAIPRDDYVDVPGYGKHKIKEAYGMAKADADADLEEQGVTDPAEREQRSRDAGRRSTIETVQKLLRVPIDHFAEVNLVGFYDIAEALGPLEVCLNAPVDDPYSGANFPAGRQMLDPSQALSFVRQRHGSPTATSTAPAGSRRSSPPSSATSTSVACSAVSPRCAGCSTRSRATSWSTTTSIRCRSPCVRATSPGANSTSTPCRSRGTGPSTVRP